MAKHLLIRYFLLSSVALLPLLTFSVHAQVTNELTLSEITSPETIQVEEKESHGLISHTLWYIPNRILDILDIFRFRLSVGPGLGAGVRVTDYAAFYGGTQKSAYTGLPGPRSGSEIKTRSDLNVNVVSFLPVLMPVMIYLTHRDMAFPRSMNYYI